jgi:hypothetical protein
MYVIIGIHNVASVLTRKSTSHNFRVMTIFFKEQMENSPNRKLEDLESLSLLHLCQATGAPGPQPPPPPHQT